MVRGSTTPPRAVRAVRAVRSGGYMLFVRESTTPPRAVRAVRAARAVRSGGCF